jgi:hypothetical protein
MSRQRTSITTGLYHHPAVLAWRKLGLSGPDPERIVDLKRKRCVVRLGRVGPGGAGVIAKLCQRDKGRLERAVYLEVLPRLPVSAIEFFGCVDDDDGTSMWLFVEDVGDERYDPDSSRHGMLAGHWFGTMQAHVEPETLPGFFPERGAAYYRDCMQSILDSLSDLRSSRSATRLGHRTLQKITDDCHELALSWSILADLSDSVPVVLAHNDCLPKNVHVRRSDRGLSVAPFDWGGVGWAPAATDLGLLTLPHRGPPADDRVYSTYKTAVDDRWPDLDVDDIQRLASVGQLFWSLKVISRSIPELTSEWRRPEHVLAKLEIYERTLARSLRALATTVRPG